MKILFVWSGVTSYMADCWRALSARADVELKVVIVERKGGYGTAFRNEEVMRDLDWRVETTFSGVGAFGDWRPDVAFIVGWHEPVCRGYVLAEEWQEVPKVCCFDMPWRWQLRCLFAPFVLGRFLRRYSAAFVPGEVCARYARWLGFKRIHKGLFSIDTTRFARQSKCEVEERRYFLYIGRDAAEKRLDDMRAAHALYRERGGHLDLRMYGKGLEGGFVKPEEVPGLLRGAAAFVLASDFDPWPLVLLEAMSAGCPVIASDRCTNRPELGTNWRVFRSGDVEALARLMRGAERLGGTVRAREARENLSLAQQYDCQRWVERVEELVEGQRRRAKVESTC